MNLDDLARFRELDTQNMRAHIDALPDQFTAAWEHDSALPTTSTLKGIECVVIAAIGTLASAGDLVAALYAGSCRIPVIVYRGQELPAFVTGGNTLLIVAGAVEQLPSITAEARARGVHILEISRKADGSSERVALCWYLGTLLRLFSYAGWIADPGSHIRDAVEIMRGRIPILGIESPVVKNPAKRLGGQMIGRIPVIYGAGIMAPVARHWKTQLNENGKTWAQFEEMPDANYNAAGGTLFPTPLMTRVHVTFLLSPSFDPPSIARRHELTFDLYMQQGIAVDKVKGRGSNPLSQMMSTIQYGDYVSYYVAMAYGVDPTPTPAISELEEKLKLTEQ